MISFETKQYHSKSNHVTQYDIINCHIIQLSYRVQKKKHLITSCDAAGGIPPSEISIRQLHPDPFLPDQRFLGKFLRYLDFPLSYIQTADFQCFHIQLTMMMMMMMMTMMMMDRCWGVGRRHERCPWLESGETR